ncbi:hypothetical protein NDU88_002662 [Pleurodeles waltl]|uniref:Uncharacterized protein n=1 Tax=Pleurodeles waltl TaxID=8319 RepID=A0AAV7WQ59_PLEWA|nr:hypothetical protein NDU88_002662 [Pleurodeles waltl]
MEIQHLVLHVAGVTLQRSVGLPCIELGDLAAVLENRSVDLQYRYRIATSNSAAVPETSAGFMQAASSANVLLLLVSASGFSKSFLELGNSWKRMMVVSVSKEGSGNTSF